MNDPEDPGPFVGELGPGEPVDGPTCGDKIAISMSVDLANRIMGETHEVLNQPPPLENCNMFEQDQALLDLMGREDTDWGVDEVREFVAILGQLEWAPEGRRPTSTCPSSLLMTGWTPGGSGRLSPGLSRADGSGH